MHRQCLCFEIHQQLFGFFFRRFTSLAISLKSSSVNAFRTTLIWESLWTSFFFNFLGFFFISPPIDLGKFVTVCFFFGFLPVAPLEIYSTFSLEIRQFLWELHIFRNLSRFFFFFENCFRDFSGFFSATSLKYACCFRCISKKLPRKFPVLGSTS